MCSLALPAAVHQGLAPRAQLQSTAAVRRLRGATEGAGARLGGSRHSRGGVAGCTFSHLDALCSFDMSLAGCHAKPPKCFRVKLLQTFSIAEHNQRADWG